MTLNILIADDEASARRKLTRFLSKYHDVKVVGVTSNGSEALALIVSTKPDIVFLDIQMPDLDGLRVAEALGQMGRRPLVVFVTAFDYAVKAFELQVDDYLLKPYDRQRFDKVLIRLRKVVEVEGASERASMIPQESQSERYVRRLLIPSVGRSFFLKTSEIIRLESNGNNVSIHSSRGKYSLRVTLESLDARLDPSQFARVHRSHIVNIDEIAGIHPWFHGDFKIVMNDGSEISWSRRYAAKRPDLRG